MTKYTCPNPECKMLTEMRNATARHAGNKIFQRFTCQHCMCELQVQTMEGGRTLLPEDEHHTLCVVRFFGNPPRRIRAR